MSDLNPTPWRMWKRSEASGGYTIHIIDDNGEVFESGLGEEATRRIVACVNACAGIPTEPLEEEKPTLDAFQKLSDLMATAFSTKHPAMLDWVRCVFAFREAEQRAEAAEARAADLLAACKKGLAHIESCKGTVHEGSYAAREKMEEAIERAEGEGCG